MRSLRQLGIVVFALAVVVGVSACQKSQTETSSLTDSTSISAESPYPVEETPPAAETTTPPATPPATPPRTTRPPASSGTTTAARTTVRIPTGTSMDLVMVTTHNTKTANVGDPITAKLAGPLVIDGKVVAEEGATVSGTITDVKRASRSKSEEDRAALKFDFTRLETVAGTKSLNATVTSSEGKSLEASGTGTRDKLIIGGSTVAGAVIGKVAGKDTKSTIIGAVGGAVVGTGIVMAAKGHELEVPAGSKVVLRTEAPITVAVR